jgi:hypothetical protein
VRRTNPPVTSTLDAPPAVEAVLRRACFDCHSNETRWPWYSHVAPVSWLVVDDVDHGRSHLNFSEWGALSATRRAGFREQMVDEVKHGAMPLPVYLWMHPDAKVTPNELEALAAWAAQE